MLRCDPDEFEYDYDSIAQCRTRLTRDLESYIAEYTEDYGAACGDALLNYYACYANAYSRTCSDETEDACGRESARVRSLCFDDDEYYY